MEASSRAPSASDADTRAEYRSFPQPLFKMGLMNEWERIALFEARNSPHWVGKDFRAIGEERHQHPLEAMMDILLEAGEDAPNVLMTGLVHTEEELEQTFIHPSCMPESDATALATDGPLAGQSFLGAYTWATYYLRRFVRERGSLTLQEGIHRLTGLPAQRLGVPIDQSVVVGDSVWDLLAARRARALGVGLLSGGYGEEELERAGAYRVYQDPADLLSHLDEVGVRIGSTPP